MRRVLFCVALLMACVWCLATPVRAAWRRPLSPVHEKRLEEQEKRRKVYGVLQKKPTMEEKIAEEAKKAAEARKAEDAKKKAAKDSLKVGSADTTEISAEERAAKEKAALQKGKAGKSSGTAKAGEPKGSAPKVSGPRVIIIDPKK